MNAAANAMRSIVDAARLRRTVRALSDPPAAPGWNAPELSDVFGESVQHREAAVLVPFVQRGEVLSVLFTRRSEHLRNHAGQVSFPGGAVDATDAGIVAAALRETQEETGIAPSMVEPFGYLDRLDTISGFSVTPVAGFMRGDYELQLHADEVEEAFEVPLDFLLEPSTLRPETIQWRGREREIYSCEWHGRRIWGATALMLKNLIDRLERSP